jgi:hypothetical protein
MAQANANRTADLLNPESRPGNTRHVLDLIDRFGFNAVAAGAEFDELDRQAFDVSDRATLADVWSHGIRARQIRLPEDVWG